MPAAKRLRLPLLLGILLVAFGMRVLGLGLQDLSDDEAFFVHIAQQGTYLQLAGTAEPHPPLYLALLQGWILPAGVVEYAVRFPSVLFGVATVAALYQLGRQLAGEGLGLAAAVVAALNPYQIFYSQTARDYQIACFFGVVSFVMLLRAMRRPSLVPGYVTAALLAIFSHYYALTIIVFEQVVLLVWWWRGRFKGLRRWLAADLCIAAVFAPWAAYSWRTVSAYEPGHGTAAIVGETLRQTFLFYNFGTALRPQDIVWPAVAVVALLALGLYGLVRVGRGRALGLAVGYQLAPLALGLITLVHTTQFGARFLFLGSPGYVLALAGAIVLLARLQWAWSVAPLALMGGLAGLAVHNMTFSDQFSDKAYSRLAAELARRIGPKDAVVLDGVSQSLQYWYYGQLRDGIGQPVAILPLDRTGNGADGTPVDIDRTRQAIDQLASGRTGLWLIDDDSLRYDPNLDTQRILASESFRASSQGFRGQRLDYYAIGRPGPMATTSVKLDGVSLMGTSRLDHNVPAGRAAPIALAWQSARDNPPAFKESLRLLDGSGALVAQDDEPAGQGFWPASWPAGTSRQENRGLLIPVGTPPGAYKLQLVAYEAGSGKSLGQPVELGPVQVDHSAPQRPEAAGLQPANVTLGGERLVGLGLAPEVDAGEKLPLTLLWSGTTAPDAESVTVTFGGTSIVHQIGGGYSTNQWQPADVVRDQIPIRVPATMQPGEYPLLAGQTQLAKVRVLPTKRLFSPPPMPHVSNARFGDVAQLLGYDLEPGAGGIQLRLVWKALNETPVSYTVFVHALGDDGKIRAQVDQAPGTDHWDSGQIVPASYALAASGDYKLEIGMYDAAKGTRLPVCMAVSGCLEPADHLDLPPK